ncbi:MAG: Dual-specificity kinase, spindle pole body (SPB) duplication and spindle checkpoint function [Alectoria fallacina]|uniref:Dual-specificity kinase, spindle pole body (SPB) duplication and spindle checkpoint function n=1 Tax=Alectoria fallacina TaxID=1903189 RepID=A0A8H3I4A8_9LECA|nr:MAG: Dual-specificity kinase, spindle pole body (SPB) duplication and spindle checkpoint function [Alectoria fallacina]
MAAISAASPTPLGASYLDPPGHRRSRQNLRTQPSRPNLKRNVPLTQKSDANISALPQAWKFSIGDSSDDEAPVAPMKFSAEAKALLGEEASVLGGSSPSQKNESQNGVPLQERVNAVRRRSPIPLGASRLRERTASPVSSRSGSPRIVRLNVGTLVPSTLRRTEAVDNSPQQAQQQRDLITPAPRTRGYQTIPQVTKSGNTSSDAREPSSVKPSSAGSEAQAEPMSNSREHSSIHETALQMSNLSLNRTKGEETGVHGSMRIKRVGKVTGRYLSGPARRGMKRRQSDEDQSPTHEDALSSGGGQLLSSGERGESPLLQIADESPEGIDRPISRPKSPKQDRPPYVRFQSQADIITGSPMPSSQEPPKALIDTIESKPRPAPLSSKEGSPEKRVQPIFKVPPLPPLPSRFDQENEPPPTFKRNKPNGSSLSEKQKFSVMSDEKMLIPTPATVSPQRPALAVRSQNTPHRPAPPPPKMTMLETATANAGAASASQAKKKRNYISVNGKLFTRMDCIGRGGSSKVYRVMAENFKVFALKRVTLEDQDELAIRGYKGEIDLLKRLEKVDRVVTLLDWEINEERHTLSVLMEMGESDLNRVLTLRLNSEDATFDVTFTRYFWKEMLECVQAVHQYDIVHSDLKPANFLLLQGKLKLIDFGISNAIADDTVNVHREQHIGTPNYMSPEALVDSNAGSGQPSIIGKVMKLGKPSDIWSLGCILYQMTYGKPPFAHISDQYRKIIAIPNPNHVISFPDFGVGGITVPSGLIRTLRGCLNRNPTQRPTVEQLLAYGDAFLYPDAAVKDTVPVSQELIARLQHNIIKHVREKGMPSDAELSTWPAKFFASIKAAVEEGRA